MSIKQFNVTYHPIDDRIIFCFNTLDHSEYKFWLTRRVTHLILKATAQFFERDFARRAPSVESVITESQQLDRGVGFNKTYEPGDRYPLGADAILVLNAKCEMIKVDDDDQGIFSLDFLLPGGSNINLKLPIPIMKNVMLLLEESSIRAGWGNPRGTLQ